MSRMSDRAGWAPLVLVAWTLFVWGGRLRNLVRGDEDAPVSFVLAVVFCLLAVITLVTAFVGRGRHRLAVLVLAGITTVVWAVRGVQIALADHSVGFIVVHTVLALVSIGLAVVAWRAVEGDHPASSTVAAAR